MTFCTKTKRPGFSNYVCEKCGTSWLSSRPICRPVYVCGKNTEHQPNCGHNDIPLTRQQLIDKIVAEDIDNQADEKEWQKERAKDYYEGADFQAHYEKLKR